MGVTLKLDSRKCRQIDNVHESEEMIAGALLEANAFKAKHLGATHRPTAVCATYNCHGLTFAARRTQIVEPSEVRQILDEDGYQEIQRADVLPGDIAIYLGSEGDIEHSGIVTHADKSVQFFTPMILSKWGTAHEVVHRANDCPYDASNIHYYRVVK